VRRRISTTSFKSPMSSSTSQKVKSPPPKTYEKRLATGMIEKALDQLSTQSGKAPAHGKGTPSGNTPAGSETATPVTGENGEGKAKALPKLPEGPSWSGVVTTKSAKSQALDAMKALIAAQIIPVARARMRLRITCPTNLLKQAVKAAPKPSTNEDGDDAGGKATGTVKDRILSHVEEVERQDVVGEEWEVVGFVEPGAYKLLSEFVSTQTKGKARAEVLDMAVIHEDDRKA
jgi:ribosome maturation protein SDO1